MRRCCEATLGVRHSVIAMILMLAMMGSAPAHDRQSVPAPATTWFVEQPADIDPSESDRSESNCSEFDRSESEHDQADQGQADQGQADQGQADQGQADKRLEPPTVDTDQDAKGDRRNPQVVRRFWPRWRPTDEHERNHRVVREAFRDVVKEANQSTVQVYSNGHRVALGTIVDAEGLVITKASELRDTVECRLSDGRKVPAEVLNVNDELDVAVLQIPATGSPLTPIRWRRDDPPPAGSWLATVGSGEIPTAVGVVSAAPREIPMPQPVLGVMLEDSKAGARIESIMPESPADEAGLHAKDLVLEFNGKSVETRERLIELIRGMRPGDTVDLLVKRGERQLTIKATLTEINSLAQGRRVDFQNSLGGPLSTRRWGFPSVLQHDTVLRPNDCGGPIVDLAGNAVGVNIARAGRVASYALPVSALAPILNEVRQGNYVQRNTSEGDAELDSAALSQELSHTESSETPETTAVTAENN